MAKPQLTAFLTKLDAEMKKSSEAYRKAVVNKKVTTFEYRANTIKKTIITLMAYVDSGKTLAQGITKEEKEAARAYITGIQKKLNPELLRLTRELKAAFKSAIKEPDTLNIKSRTIIRVTLMAEGKRDNYAKLQGIYKEHLDAFYQRFLAILQTKGHAALRNTSIVNVDGTIVSEGTTGLSRASSSSKSGETLVDSAGSAFNLEHMIDSSNIKEFINNKVYAALEDVWDDKESGIEALKKIDGFDEDLLTIIKNVKRGEISLFIGSQILNVLESKQEKAQMAELQKKLETAIEKLGGVGELDGSDSLVTGVRKNAVKAIMKQFSTIKGAKITTETTKIIESRGSTSIKGSGKTTKSNKRPGAFIAKKKPKKAKQKRQTASPSIPNLASILGILQQKLPQTVAKNMGSPRLNNRTGRFSGSVQVTDIAQTAKGFPSIGYTYMKRPYQTFETGGAQGSADRDPRTLIDGSIREIAAGLAMGRFYTRRV
tara:strand:- start:770 stop:2227 length:1458 start_codon:yes stop_codon:yes gene_type:complete